MEISTTEKTLMGIREFAASEAIRARYGRAIAPSTVTRMAQDGKIILVGHGKYAKVDVAASIARMESLGVGKLRADVSARHSAENAIKAAQTSLGISNQGEQQKNATRASKNATTNTQTNTQTETQTETPSADNQEDLDGIAAEGGSKAKYKAAALHYENQQIKLGMALARAIRFIRHDVRDEAHSLGNNLRAALERLTDQTAPRLAIQNASADRARLIRQEIQKIKRALDQESAQSLRRLRRNARKGKAE